jgi:hypothetical protein
MVTLVVMSIVELKVITEHDAGTSNWIVSPGLAFATAAGKDPAPEPLQLLTVTVLAEAIGPAHAMPTMPVTESAVAKKTAQATAPRGRPSPTFLAIP